MSLSSKKSKHKYNRAGCKNVTREAHEDYIDEQIGYDDWWDEDTRCDCKHCSPHCGIGMKEYVWGKLLDIMARLGLRKAKEVEKELW